MSQALGIELNPRNLYNDFKDRGIYLREVREFRSQGYSIFFLKMFNSRANKSQVNAPWRLLAITAILRVQRLRQQTRRRSRIKSSLQRNLLRCTRRLSLYRHYRFSSDWENRLSSYWESTPLCSLLRQVHGRCGLTYSIRSLQGFFGLGACHKDGSVCMPVP